MANTQPQFNPAYSTIKSIYLSASLPESITTNTPGILQINSQNTQCRFEKLEIVENINEVLPAGAIMVKDLNDIETYIAANKIKHVIIQFFDGGRWNCDITSVSYMNNAASDTEETLVVINFTNLYYTYFSSRGIVELLGYKKPQIFSINEFVNQLRTVTFGVPATASGGYQDPAVNYFLYRPFVPYNSGEESAPDNAIELLNYISTYAVNKNKNPYFLFWTSIDGAVNFKYFDRDLTKDSSYARINQDYRNIGIYDGDSVLQKLSDDKTYRKAYFFATNPAFQWISKNYYYIRKTPKYLDTLTGISGACAGNLTDEQLLEQQNKTTKNLSFHFMDDGQKYNIDVITVDGRGKNAPPGGDQLYAPGEWGYYDAQVPSNNKSMTNLLGNQYGTQQQYSALSMMGLTGMMPYLDSPDMWRNMFNITPTNPNYPDKPDASVEDPVPGSSTNLQKVIDIRYQSFLSDTGLSGGSGNSSGGIVSFNSPNHLELMRQIEAQNFVMYSLCCMGQKEDCFFAVLQKYEVDSTYSNGLPTGVTAAAGGKMYRYKWNKIIFEPPTGLSAGMCAGMCAGACGAGSSGSTYGNQLENWYLDPGIKSSETQDNTWAINLNERGLTGNYLPPGWVTTNLPAQFKFRPIGLPSNVTEPIDSGIIRHFVRLCIDQSSPNAKVTYFWAENLVDGSC